MIELKFQEAKEIPVDNDFTGRKFKFLYSITYLSKGSETDKVYQNTVIVSISNDLIEEWNYSNNNDLIKVLFQHYVCGLILDKLIENNLREIEKIPLETNSPNVKKIYDPNKIEYYNNITFTIDLEELKGNRNKGRMGFQIP